MPEAAKAYKTAYEAVKKIVQILMLLYRNWNNIIFSNLEGNVCYGRFSASFVVISYLALAIISILIRRCNRGRSFYKFRRFFIYDVLPMGRHRSNSMCFSLRNQLESRVSFSSDNMPQLFEFSKFALLLEDYEKRLPDYFPIFDLHTIELSCRSL